MNIIEMKKRIKDLKNVKDELKEKHFSMKRDNKLFLKAFLFFKTHTASVQIERDQKHEMHYFPVPPYCLFLNKDMKKSVIENLDRTSTRSKSASLVEETPALIITLQHYLRYSSINYVILVEFRSFSQSSLC